jgi:hypothetical protein
LAYFNFSFRALYFATVFEKGKSVAKAKADAPKILRAAKYWGVGCNARIKAIALNAEV